MRISQDLATSVAISAHADANALPGQKEIKASVTDRQPEVKKTETTQKISPVTADLVQINYSYRIDQTTGQVIVSLIDNESGETVRQIPTEEAIELMHRIREVLERINPREDL